MLCSPKFRPRPSSTPSLRRRSELLLLPDPDAPNLAQASNHIRNAEPAARSFSWTGRIREFYRAMFEKLQRQPLHRSAETAPTAIVIQPPLHSLSHAR